ncbi:MAG: rRNA maturation RNase YbeY [Ketobacteraceae bacterium]|nr:rRNA maturation RNase YbeY [Ketobacteraceae bacterium]
MATLELDVQIASDDDDVPEPGQLEQWILSALDQGRFQADEDLPVEMTVRIVDSEESRQLNHTYRQKNQPTNVLSFPFDSPAGVPLQLLGDLVICAPVVRQEAREQHKSLESHWAHMVIHGTLHLLGYDHIKEEDASTMEALETDIMEREGYSDPYEMRPCHSQQ